MPPLADPNSCRDVLDEPISPGTVVAFPFEGSLHLGVVRGLDRMTCRVRMYWNRRGRSGESDALVGATDCVVIPQTRLRRGNEEHDRLIQNTSQCQT